MQFFVASAGSGYIYLVGEWVGLTLTAEVYREDQKTATKLTVQDHRRHRGLSSKC